MSISVKISNCTARGGIVGINTNKRTKVATPTVWIESPFWAETEEEMEVNILYSRYLVSYAFGEGLIPISPNLIVAALPSETPVSIKGMEGYHERLARRCKAGGDKIWRDFSGFQEAANTIWVGMDLGVSPGMKKCLDEYTERVRIFKVRERLLGDLKQDPSDTARLLEKRLGIN